jgi:hypothetical protein
MINGFFPGDAVWINADIPGTIMLTSGNGLVLQFGAIIDGHVGVMPVMLMPEGYYASVLTGHRVTIIPRATRAA